MELSNECSRALNEGISKETVSFALSTLASLLFPFAPHIASEVYYELTGKHVWKEEWPAADEGMLRTETIEIVIQINGKLRGQIRVSADASDKDIEEATLALDLVRTAVAGRIIKRVIVVPGRLVNVVV